MSRDDVIETLKSGRIDYVRVEFIDILGNVRGRSLRRAEFENLILKESGVPYPESLVLLDYKDIPLKTRYEDIIAQPDPSTFVVLPYLERTARVLSYLASPDLIPSQYCSRGLLRKATEKLEEIGYKLNVAFEPTFYLLKIDDGNIIPADYGKAFSPEGLMEEQGFLRDMIKSLEQVGVQVEMVNKHYGPGQYEITFSSKEALQASDSLITAREVIRDVARIYNTFATYMPKPFSDKPGSSMDIYFSLEGIDGKRIIDNNDSKGFGLSKTAYSFIAGIMEHLGSILAFAAPTINSYKRFKEVVTPTLPGIGTERHYIIRIPSNFKDTNLLEFRLADPLSNSYLLLSSIIFSGIDGIEKNLDIEPNAIMGNIPSNISDALEKLNRDNYLKYTLGSDLISSFIELKKREIENYESYITNWELDAYLKAGW